MAVFRLPFVKSLVSSLSGISRSSSAQFCRPLGSSVSSVNLERPNVERNVDNIVYSRHDDCILHDLTITQRFFDQASLWPNNVAVVRTETLKQNLPLSPRLLPPPSSLFPDQAPPSPPFNAAHGNNPSQLIVVESKTESWFSSFTFIFHIKNQKQNTNAILC